MNTAAKVTYSRLEPGEPAPWFSQRSTGNPRFVFDTAAGRYIVLCFFGSAGEPGGRKAVGSVLANRDLFDDDRAAFFGVSNDPADESEKRIAESLPGIRYFLDFDGTVSKLYGVMPREAEPGKPAPLRRMWVLLDPTLRVMAMFPVDAGGGGAPLFALLRTLPPPQAYAGLELQAPVLFLPNVFEPAFCKGLIDVYEAHGGEESGFMREIDGKTIAIHDHGHKRRRDYNLEDQKLIDATRDRIRRRIVPEILKVHNFKVTRMERYLVGCYTAEDGGHFRAHRDNTTKGTAHRRFAVSINLNAEFEGGEVSFPEYGPRSFKPPPGGAVVFSCALLHAVSKVTAGRRYACLPFLYDDEAAKIREANDQFLGEGVGYKAAVSPAS
jgi:peroxiredoxin